MKEMYTGRKNEEANSRAEEERLNFNFDSRRSGETGSESESSWLEQERANRANSQRPSIVCVGATITGGMLDHLIEDYAEQVDTKLKEVGRLNEDINRYSEDIKKLNFRIQELTALREELKQQLSDKQ